MRLAAGVLVLVVLLARLGTGPFVDGLRSTSPWTLLVALAVTAVTTVCCALRWRVVAAALGARLDLSTAIAAVYRAQLLNVVLPSGVLGDVDRAVGHGRHLGRLGPALRAVAWERALGQVVQVALTTGLLVALPSPLRPGPLVTVAAVLAGGLLVLLARQSARVLAEVGGILRPPGVLRVVTLTSVVATSGHLLVFLVAAQAAGVDAPALDLLPLAAVVLVASSLPLNVAGWGPREGVAAWAFAAAGLGPGTGLTVSVAYGVLAAVATLPGALALLTGRGTFVPARVPPLEEAVHG